ncbi:MAG: YfhO family protein [Bacteroidetes bacterium]|nr:YfhO family protein [Bacteroidota bacterium]
MNFTVETKTSQMFTLMQQFYPGWKAAINGSETKISVANYLHMSVPVKPGKSEVVFSFNNKAIKNWFYVSATFFIAAIFWLLVFALKKVV